MKLGQKGDEEEDNEKLVRGVHLLTPLMLLVALVGSALSGAPIFLDYITSAVAAGLLLMAGFAASRRFPILPAIATVLAVQAHQSARAHFLYPILYERYGMWFEFQWFSVLALSAFVMHWSYAQHLKSRRPDPKPDPDAEREEDEA